VYKVAGFLVFRQNETLWYLWEACDYSIFKNLWS